MIIARARSVERLRAIRLSQAIALLLLIASLGLFAVPIESGAGWAIEIGLRAYLMFLCTVMAHEGSHGHLGRTRVSNDWWGRLALVPTLVPYLNFRKTHRMHHACTNLEGEDPDLFVKPNHWWEVPLRSVAIPHYWLIWLRRRGWLDRRDLIELAVHYLAITALYVGLAAIFGLARVALSLFPALVVVSIWLWYLFAVQTHQGFSTGAAEERSHNYYGRFMFWLSLGLSMHRIHHLRPSLTWIELHAHVEPAPGWRRWLPFQRDIRRSAS